MVYVHVGWFVRRLLVVQALLGFLHLVWCRWVALPVSFSALGSPDDNPSQDSVGTEEAGWHLQPLCCVLHCVFLEGLPWLTHAVCLEQFLDQWPHQSAVKGSKSGSKKVRSQFWTHLLNEEWY